MNRVNSFGTCVCVSTGTLVAEDERCSGFLTSEGVKKTVYVYPYHEWSDNEGKWAPAEEQKEIESMGFVPHGFSDLVSTEEIR